MKKTFFIIILLFIILLSCKKESSPIDLEISRRSLSIDDTLHIKIINKTNEDYLLYFDNKKLHYIDVPLSLYLEITHNQTPVKINYSISDPLWMLDENGKMSLEDSLQQKKYFDCINKDRSIIVKLPAKKSIKFNIPLIDSVDECGRENYPILEKGNLYKAKFIVNSDSSLISPEGMNKIKKIRKKDKLKLFQGTIESNMFILKY